MFGTVPKTLWQKCLPPDDLNRVRLSMRSLLLESDTHVILVDCGLGDKGDQKFRSVFAVDQNTESLEKSLAKANKKVDDITDVIITHLHFDHAGGISRLDANGKYAATFPNARYHIQQKNFALATSPNPREKASYLPEIYQDIEKDRWVFHNGDKDAALPGLDLMVSKGHTEAQQHPIVDTEYGTVFYAGDLIPTIHHIRLPWIMGYDVRPLDLLDEKQALLKKAFEQKWIIFFEHDPSNICAKIQKGPKYFEPELGHWFT